MLKKPLQIAAVAATIALAATGCAPAGSDSTGASGELSGKVTLWMYPVIKDETVSKKFWSDTEADFEKKHPGVDLTIELQTFDKRDAQISAALAANSGPDIALVTPDQAATYLAVGGLLPVDEAVNKERESFVPATLKSATFDGELYGVPIFQNINSTAYNTKIFADAGLDLPETWADVKAAAPVLAEKGIAVMDYAGSPEQTLNLTFYPLLWQAGGTVFTEDGKDIAFDSAEGVEALQFLVDLMESGGLPIDAAVAGSKIDGAPIAGGKVAMRATTSLAELGLLRGALGDENVVLGAPLKGNVQATYGNPGLLALTSINKKENRDAAYEVLSYLSSAEAQAALNAAASNFPTRTDVKSEDENADTDALNAALEFANFGEASPVARQVMAILAPSIQAALGGKVTAKEALSKAADEARALLKRS
ncbi:ABC-type sugar transport system, periplasmic component [Arthrobacter sp. PAMC 25486]|uniref:extracellular solute-binding protein n=1 Tax=Arthrobacter sp. PAMC 25486 TaxID=1494608 RepID=UPI000535C979|nr:extracellular solute-binding protein [Arthrobacter sp. PAMC 25486]AIY02244.1 ABC-type sugar transport system, periplasmic component [Arthrobacter sp. PAMC 25486]